jgi:hypothetical protein
MLGPMASSRQNRRRWGLAIVVNLAAAVVAALAFGAWKRFESSETAATQRYVGGTLYDLAGDVGYVPRAGIEMPARSEAEGRVVYDVTYTTGPDHFRVVPAAAEDADACILLFGDSFTFGVGVRDHETFAAQIVKLSGGKVAAQNFGVPGWGPHQFLAGLQSGRFQNAIRCKPTDAVFLMIPSHIWRAAGATNRWDTNGPRYGLGSDGRPVRDGALGDEDPYNWRRWIGLTPSSKEAAARLAVAILAEAMDELKRRFPGIRTHLIAYRVASWTDTDLDPDDMARFEHDLRKAGIMPLPLDAIIPRFRLAYEDYVVAPTDSHPNALAHRLIAEFVLRELSARKR